MASIGRLLQGAGGVFALVGAIYIATKYFPASQAATLIGATQMFGMAGGAAGQFAVGPAIAAGLPWSHFWTGMGIAGLTMGTLLFFLLPREEAKRNSGDWLKTATRALYVVFRNPQSILCGLISGLLFIPTTIFDMVWGVSYLQEGHSLEYASAVMRTASVPIGWIVGCPLLGFMSDRLGRRKPVIIGGAVILLACLGWILFGQVQTLPRYVVGFLAGVGSGAAMLLYVVIKEANPPEFGGTAAGVINFLNFSFSALLGPVFAGLLEHLSRGATQRELVHYQTAFLPLLFGVVGAIGLSFLLKETGPAVQSVKTQ
jgi:MFS family permease